MKEYPIIFNTAMVLALLSGRKTQTRRLAWENPYKKGKQPRLPFTETLPTVWQDIQAGDELWVRENVSYDDAGHFPSGQKCVFVNYKADNASTWCGVDEFPKSLGNRPSIHMHYWASRLTLEVMDVRREPLQDITEEDAISEGALFMPNRPGYETDSILAKARGEKPPLGDSPRTRFIRLWKELYGIASWDANPEVVVMSYRVRRE